MGDSGIFFVASLIKLAFVTIVIGWIPALIAYKKGRNFFLWWIYGGALFIIALVHACLIKPQVEQEPEKVEQEPESWFYDQFPTNPGPRVYYVFWYDKYNGGYHCWLAKTKEEAMNSVEGEEGIEVKRYGSFPTETADIAKDLLTEACGYEDEEEYIYGGEKEELSEEELDQPEKKMAEYYSEERLSKIWSKLDSL